MTFFIVKNLNIEGKKPKTKVFSDVGSEELFMARLFDFNRIINGILDGEKQKNAKEAVMKMIFEGFELAFVALCELQKAESNENYPENKKEKNAKDMISYLVVAYKDRLQKIATDLGYNIGFIYSKDVNFGQGANKFISEHGNIDKKIIDVIRRDRAGWQKVLFDIRNILINHQKNTDIEDIARLKKYLNYQYCNLIFDNCWKATEDILFVLMRGLIDSKYGIDLCELKDY